MTDYVIRQTAGGMVLEVDGEPREVKHVEVHRGIRDDLMRRTALTVTTPAGRRFAVALEPFVDSLQVVGWGRPATDAMSEPST